MIREELKQIEMERTSCDFQFKQIKQHKKRINYTINKHTIDRFKVVTNKDMKKMSNIVENLIRRYVESRVQLDLSSIFSISFIIKSFIISAPFIDG